VKSTNYEAPHHANVSILIFRSSSLVQKISSAPCSHLASEAKFHTHTKKKTRTSIALHILILRFQRRDGKAEDSELNGRMVAGFVRI